MAEKDCEGFYEFLHNFWLVIAPLFNDDITFGGFDSTDEDMWDNIQTGYIIAGWAGALVGFVIALINSARKDDIFPPKTCSVLIPSAIVNFNGSNLSPTFKLNFENFGGKYSANLYWKLTR